MGSIGSSENDYKAQLVQSGKIVQFKNDEYDEELANDSAVQATPAPGGWDYPGIRDSINEVEAKAANARSTNTYQRLIKRLNELDRTITTSLETGDDRDDKRALMSYRRRTRTLLRQLKERYKNEL